MDGLAETPGSLPDSDESYDYYAGGTPVALPTQQAAASPSAGSSLDMDTDVSASEIPIAKRRYSDSRQDLEIFEENASKRLKVQSSAELPPATQAPKLPTAVWQHILSFLPLNALCLCLRVDQDFRSYLTTTKASRTRPTSFRTPTPRLSEVDSETIWTMSRRAFAPLLPRPLSGITEHQMLILVGQTHCQVCRAQDSRDTQATSVWDSGPGSNGVRVIWPFAARLCGRCFSQKTITVRPDDQINDLYIARALIKEQDIELLQTSAAKLRLGMLTAFKTADMHYVLTSTNKLPGGMPQHANPSKVYYHKHVGDLQGEYEDAKTYGEAAQAEWIKGLSERGKSEFADANRWVHWEVSLPIGSSLAQTLREYCRPSSENQVSALPVHAYATGSSSSVQPHLTHPLPNRVGFPSSVDPTQATVVPSKEQPHQHRPRNQQEVNAAKAARKAEIEKRCRLDFYPPLMPNVLQHMESFKLSLQISQPLTDAAWSILKPLLDEQRPAAELIEHERWESLRALQSTMQDHSHNESTVPDLSDHEWEALQEPVRLQLGAYADEFIREHWQDGQAVNKENSPNFASALLIHVGQKFWQDSGAPKNNEDNADSGAQPLPLSLDNMRWVVDNKVRPITDPLRRDLFLCSDCDYERRSFKLYPFEGMIQHFGAKHSEEFSRGNIIVHWQSAKWPKEPPFVPHPIDCPDPIPAKPVNASASQSLDKSNVSKTQPLQPFASTFDLNDPANQSAIQQLLSTFGGGAPADGLGQSRSPASHTFASSMPSSSQGIHQTHTEHMQISPGLASIAADFQSSSTHAPRTNSAPVKAPSFHNLGESHQDRINFFAEVARSVWDSIGEVKDLLDSIKIHTVLHHTVSQFKSRYGSIPNLDIVTEVLVNHELMRPIKEASKLACNTCVSNNWNDTVAYQYYAHRIAVSKLYNISSLVLHYKTTHAFGPDWTKDMIEMPEAALIQDLLTRPGMDDAKLAIISEAFPNTFPKPLPQIGVVTEPEAPPKIQQNKRRQQGPKHGRRINQNRNAHQFNAGIGFDAEDSERSMPEAGEDEYDPRRPAFLASVATGTKRRRSEHQSTVPATQSNTDAIAQLIKQHPALADPQVLQTLLNAAASQGGQQKTLGNAGRLPEAKESRDKHGRNSYGTQNDRRNSYEYSDGEDLEFVPHRRTKRPRPKPSRPFRDPGQRNNSGSHQHGVYEELPDVIRSEVDPYPVEPSGHEEVAYYQAGGGLANLYQTQQPEIHARQARIDPPRQAHEQYYQQPIIQRQQEPAPMQYRDMQGNPFSLRGTPPVVRQEPAPRRFFDEHGNPFYLTETSQLVPVEPALLRQAAPAPWINNPTPFYSSTGRAPSWEPQEQMRYEYD